MNGLIGYTGFVGQNLDDSLYDYRFNSKNIEEIDGKSFDLLVCAGVPGHKTLANNFPEHDWRSISNLTEHLSNTKCKKFVLISTTDVLPVSGLNEDAELTGNGMNAYARHRIKAEEFVKKHFDNLTIIRLPGIFGKGLKKNFIFDLIFRIPKMFTAEDFSALKTNLTRGDSDLLDACYAVDDKGIFCLKPHIDNDDLKKLRQIMEKNNCTSMRFTDSRSIFSYYDLSRLKSDIQKILQNDIPLINIATEPMSAAGIAEDAFNIKFVNEIPDKTPLISYSKSNYAPLFSGTEGYLYGRDDVIRQLKKFSANSEELISY